MVCGVCFDSEQKGMFSFVAECARIFHAAGARLVLCGRDAARLQRVVQELTTNPTGSRQVGELLSLS